MLSRDVEAYDAMCDATSAEPVETPFGHELDTREDLGPAPTTTIDAIFSATREQVSTEPCTAASHAETVNRAWDTLITHADAAGLAWGTCPHCKSTLCKQLPVSRYWLNRRDDVVRVEFTDGTQDVVSIDDLDSEDDRNAILAARDGDADSRFAGIDFSEQAAVAAMQEAA